MCGKATTHLLRLTGTIHCLMEAVKFLKNKNIVDSNKTNLSKQFVSAIEKEFQDSAPNISLINASTVLMAEQLLIYFNRHRLIFSCYKFDYENDLYGEIKKILSEQNEMSKIQNFNSRQIYVFSKILYNAGENVMATKLCQDNRINIDEFYEASRHLQEFNFGKLEIFKAANARETYKFVKKPFEDIERDLNIVTILNKLKIDSFKFRDSYNSSKLSNLL